MFRFLGFLVGSALVALPALLLLGPTHLQWPFEDPESGAPAEDRTVPRGAVAAVVDAGERLRGQVPPPATPSVPAPFSVAPPIPAAGQAESATGDGPVQIPAQGTVAGASAITAGTSREAGLFLLWSPFRTEAAARGFARRLTRSSGIEVHVAQAEPGRYRVGFHYRDDVQKNWYLGQITARTGLELDERSPVEGAESDEPVREYPVDGAPAVAVDSGAAE